jgi:acyl dehydratase
MSSTGLLDELRRQVGKEIHVSDWLEVTQARIDAFAEATGDRQWIHVDVARARRELPGGTTIAHGYLTLSLFPMLRGLAASDEPPFPGARQVLNYGLDRLRFPGPVPAGSRVRARSTLIRVEEIPGGIQVAEQLTLEVEGRTRPACVAEAIVRVLFDEAAQSRD